MWWTCCLSFRNKRLNPILDLSSDLGEHVWVAGEAVDADDRIPVVKIIWLEVLIFHSQIHLPLISRLLRGLPESPGLVPKFEAPTPVVQMWRKLEDKHENLGLIDSTTLPPDWPPPSSSPTCLNRDDLDLNLHELVWLWILTWFGITPSSGLDHFILVSHAGVWGEADWPHPLAELYWLGQSENLKHEQVDNSFHEQRHQHYTHRRVWTFGQIPSSPVWVNINLWHTCRNLRSILIMSTCNKYFVKSPS